MAFNIDNLAGKETDREGRNYCCNCQVGGGLPPMKAKSGAYALSQRIMQTNQTHLRQ